MSGTPTIDTARLPMLLTQLRLPTVARLWRALTDTADRESWPAAKTLAALMEHEIAERARRRTAHSSPRLPSARRVAVCRGPGSSIAPGVSAGSRAIRTGRTRERFTPPS